MTKQLNFKTDAETRAIRAYFRQQVVGQLQTPSLPPERRVLDGREYFRFSNSRGTLAVYEVRANGSLKGLQEWPAGIND